MLQQLDGYPHNEHKIWRMASAKTESAKIKELLEFKNNPLSLPEPEYIITFDIFGNIENNSEYFYEHYQNLALTRKEQKQRLADLNTKLCNYCLISYPTENTKTEQYFAYSDLSKELELKWYSDNKERICPKRVHDIDAENYLFMPEKIDKLHLENLSTPQQMQLKVLLNQYANVFASENEFGCINIMKH
ncbi:hypothetical protein G9A89_002591 [Geosiphon pyriformis]|nr:hypothetical protein G9A89_002591 [Geosiphon pyriformis]